MFNTVNEVNFNETMKGYIIRACQIVHYTEEQRDNLFSGLRWAVDIMTMEDAREEWQNYINGNIKFKSESNMEK